MLHSIPADNATFCGRRIINYTTLRLNDTVFKKTKVSGLWLVLQGIS